jgi:hypothetical protein
MRLYSTVELIVRQRASGFVITLVDQRKPLATVIPDEKYPGMWRVIEDNGDLSDMVNLSRAVDAAMSRALSRLNKPIEPSPQWSPPP